MQARTSASSRPGYWSRTCGTVHPEARRSRTRDTQIRCPRMHGFPKHTFGSMEILDSSSSLVIVAPAYEPSPPGEAGRALLLEGLHAFLVVGGLAHHGHVGRHQVEMGAQVEAEGLVDEALDHADRHLRALGEAPRQVVGDRKSTRLNSSHSQISYAVF